MIEDQIGGGSDEVIAEARGFVFAAGDGLAPTGIAVHAEDAAFFGADMAGNGDFGPAIVETIDGIGQMMGNRAEEGFGP